LTTDAAGRVDLVDGQLGASWVVLSEFGDSPATCQNRANEIGWLSLAVPPDDGPLPLEEAEPELPQAARQSRTAPTAINLNGFFLAASSIIDIPAITGPICPRHRHRTYLESP
jgi:hypothetical protein